MSGSDLLDEFCDSLWLEDGLSRNTLESYRRDLSKFSAWLEPLGLTVALRTLDFPALTSLYQARPLTATEQQQLAAFFQSIYLRRLPASPTRAIALAAAAVFAALFLLSLLAAGRHRAYRRLD